MPPRGTVGRLFDARGIKQELRLLLGRREILETHQRSIQYRKVDDYVAPLHLQTIRRS